MISEDAAITMLELAGEIGILEALFPSLSIAPNAFETMKRPSAPNSLEVNFAALLGYSVSHGSEEALIRRLNMDSSWAKAVRDSAYVRSKTDELGAPALKNSEVYRLIYALDENALHVGSVVIQHRAVAQRILLYLSDLRHVIPAIDGDDLLRLGAPQGPIVGALLQAILWAKLDGELLDRESEERFVREQLLKLT